MKWWARIKDLRNHRWLPFYLPIIGTILYIIVVLIAVPSQFGEKADAESGDAEKTADKSHAGTSVTKKARRPGLVAPAAAKASAGP